MTSQLALLTLDLQSHHLAIIDAAQNAGERLVSMQTAICSYQHLTLKADGSIVTAADIASEDILLAAIRRHAPGPHHVVSEERPISPMLDAAQPTWFVDPLDGTRNYANGSADYAVLVSEWIDGVAEFSIVYYPAFGQLAVAIGSQAKWVLSEAAKPPLPSSSIVHVCYMRSATLRQLVTEAGANYHEDKVESTRALLDVATGAASAAVVFLCGHKSWDLAPLLHLVAATGGCISDEAGRSVRICGSGVFGRYVIAARDLALHEILTDALRTLTTSE